MTVTLEFRYDNDKDLTCKSTKIDDIRKFVVKKKSLENKLFVLTKGDSIPCDSVNDGDTLTIRKVTIVLDLDETLLHALCFNEIPEDLKKNPPKEIAAHVMDDDKDDDPNPYVIFVRPGLYPFLEHIFKSANVCVWTAASRDYALWIIKNILRKNDKGEPVSRDFKVFLSSHHCDISYDKEDGHKVLSCFNDEFKLHDLDKNAFNYNDVCLLIDDSSAAKKGNSDPTKLHQCFKIKAFELNDQNRLDVNDTTLQDLQSNIQPDTIQQFLCDLHNEK